MMRKIFYISCSLLVLLGVLVSCSDSDNKPDGGGVSNFGNADQLPGDWKITQKYLIVNASEGDKIQDSQADIIKPMNSIFNNWINNGSINLKYNTLLDLGSLKGAQFEEKIYLMVNDINKLQKSNSGKYYIQSNNKDVTIEYTESQSYGGVWSSTSQIGVVGNSFYMKQKLLKEDLDLLWKIYGDGNREFFSTDQVTMITRGVRVVY